MPPLSHLPHDAAAAIAYVALGSNMGERREHLEAALSALAVLPGTRLDAVSAIYETAPVGPPGQQDFLNAVVRLVTTLPPLDLLDALLAIEKSRGRIRAERWGPRTLDLDLLLHGDTALDHPRLTLPHPRLHERAFVLAPFADLAPDLVVGGRSIAQHLAAADRAGVRKI